MAGLVEKFERFGVRFVRVGPGRWEVHVPPGLPYPVFEELQANRDAIKAALEARYKATVEGRDAGETDTATGLGCPHCGERWAQFNPRGWRCHRCGCVYALSRTPEAVVAERCRRCGRPVYAACVWCRLEVSVN